MFGACWKYSSGINGCRLRFRNWSNRPDGVPRKPCPDDSYLTHEVFNRYHAEHEILRYLYRLQARDSP